MGASFQGVRWVSPADLAVSQLYLNRAKLESLEKRCGADGAGRWPPLPVHDFGDGRLTLTDGHHRAFIAFRRKSRVPIVYDTDAIVTGGQGRLLYESALLWCRRSRLRSVADLESRIVSDAEYRVLWDGRCERARNLLAKTTARERAEVQRRHPDLYLYGVSGDLTVWFFDGPGGDAVQVRL